MIAVIQDAGSLIMTWCNKAYSFCGKINIEYLGNAEFGKFMFTDKTAGCIMGVVIRIVYFGVTRMLRIVVLMIASG